MYGLGIVPHGNVCSGKGPFGEFAGCGTVRRENVRRGIVRRGNVCRGNVRCEIATIFVIIFEKKFPTQF